MRYTVEAEDRRGGEGRDLGAHKHAPRSTYRPLDVSPAQGRAVAEGQAVASAPKRLVGLRASARRERRTRAEHDRPRENHADRRIASEGEKDEEHHRDGASKPEEPSVRNDSQSYPTKPADQRRESPRTRLPLAPFSAAARETGPFDHQSTAGCAIVGIRRTLTPARDR